MYALLGRSGKGSGDASMMVAFGEGARAGGGNQAKIIQMIQKQAQGAWDFVRAREQRLRDDAVGADPAQSELKEGDEVLVNWENFGGMEGTAKMRPRFGGPS